MCFASFLIVSIVLTSCFCSQCRRRDFGKKRGHDLYFSTEQIYVSKGSHNSSAYGKHVTERKVTC